MEGNKEQIVYWTLLNCGPWEMYIAATTERVFVMLAPACAI